MIAGAVRAGARIPAPLVGCFYEFFSEGLTPYTASSGDTSIFSVVNEELRVAAQSGGSAWIQRPFTMTRPAVIFSGRAWVNAGTSDDGCGAYLHNAGGTEIMGFQPRSSVANDPSQRGSFFFGADTVRIGSAALAFGEWYSFEIAVAAGAGNTICTLRRESNGATLTQAFSGNHSPPSVAALRFFVDSSATTAATAFDSIVVCPRR